MGFFDNYISKGKQHREDKLRLQQETRERNLKATEHKKKLREETAQKLIPFFEDLNREVFGEFEKLQEINVTYLGFNEKGNTAWNIIREKVHPALRDTEWCEGSKSPWAGNTSFESPVMACHEWYLSYTGGYGRFLGIQLTLSVRGQPLYIVDEKIFKDINSLKKYIGEAIEEEIAEKTL